MIRSVTVPAAGVPFKNNAAYCVGTGRMGLALQQEYLDHLDLVQEAIRFRYIRGHGLFCDDMSIYRELDSPEGPRPYYNFTYLDRVVDSYLARGIRPFLELGFMPEKLKSGEQTIFYWKGNVTPPNDFDKWEILVEHTLAHLAERYGHDEVATWPVEVWNEPNIGFWAGTMQEYFHLYEVSARAVKRVDPRIPVGGPAICGVDTEHWLRSFFSFVTENDLPIDMVTRHCYTANQPRREGFYVHHSLRKNDIMIDELRETRQIMDDYPRIAGLPLHITEFSTSYVPRCPVHDTVYNAAYIARILSEAGDYADSYSYWTFSDVFEEADVPISVLHGGFGLVGLESIKKPTFWTFAFFSRAGGELVYRDENLIVTRDGDRYAIIGWHADATTDQSAEPISYNLRLPGLSSPQCLLLKQSVGGKHANPLQTWSNLGKPYTLDDAQRRILRASAEPLQRDEKLFAREDGWLEVSVSLPSNHLCMLEITPVEDRTATYAGFDAREHYGLE